MARKKILLVSHSHLLSGGAELSLLEIILFLRNENFEVKVILPAKGPFSEQLRKLKIPYKLISARWSVTFRGDKTKTKKAFEVFNADSIIEAYKIINTFKPDVVITNTIVQPWFGYAAKSLGVPHALIISEAYDDASNLQLLPNDKIYLEQIKYTTDYIFYNSKFTQNTYSSVFTDIECCILYPVFTIKSADAKLLQEHVSNLDNNLKMIVMGSVIAHKNQLEVLQALSLVREKGVNATLTILGPTGSSNYLSVLKKFITTHKLKSVVSFLPYSPDPFSIVANHDIIVVPSLSETFGRVTIEGQLLGRVVIGSKVGGTTELIDDGTTGLLYTSCDSVNLASQIEWVAHNAKAAEQIATVGQNDAIKKFIHTNSNTVLLSQINRLAEIKTDQGDVHFNFVRALIERNIYVTDKIRDYGEALDASIKENNRLGKLLHSHVIYQAKKALFRTKTE